MAEMLLALVATLAVLFLVARGMPRGSWLPAALLGVILVVVVLLAERLGVWPDAWRR